MKKFYVILDTNVVVSGLLGTPDESYPAKLLNYVYDEIIVPVYSDDIIVEYKKVLNRKEFHFTKKQKGDFINSVMRFGLKIDPTKEDFDLIDRDDIVFYEVLMTKDSKEKYLTTGNLKHFPKNKYIKLPKEMVDIINSRK